MMALRRADGISSRHRIPPRLTGADLIAALASAGFLSTILRDCDLSAEALRALL
jgi:hypothetical protein